MKISEFFSDYATAVSERIGHGDIIKILHTVSMTNITVVASFEEVLSYEEIAIFENSISEAVGVEKISLDCKYTPDKFTVDYFPTLVEKLKKKAVAVNGFFNNAEVQLENGDLSISLANGGYSILSKNKTDLAISKLIYDEFSVNINVSFVGKLNVEEEAYEKMQQEAISALPKIEYAPPPPIEPEKEYSYIPNNEPKVVTIDFRDLPILSENAKIIRGKKISDAPQSIIDVTQDSGFVTIWGDVFDRSDKETRDGKKVIVSIYVTDYTSSICLKIIEKKKRWTSLQI